MTTSIFDTPRPPVDSNELSRSDLHAVFATDAARNTWRVSDPLDNDAAHREWERLDTKRREHLLPHVRFFEVRTVLVGPDRPLVGPEIRSHDRYDGAKVNLSMTREVVPGRGYGTAEAAAKVAWKAFAPTFTSWWDKRQHALGGPRQRTGTQGNGGWFYYPNGQTAAQGLRDLAKVAKRRGLIVEGANGRWYVHQIEQL